MAHLEDPPCLPCKAATGTASSEPPQASALPTRLDYWLRTRSAEVSTCFTPGTC